MGKKWFHLWNVLKSLKQGKQDGSVGNTYYQAWGSEFDPQGPHGGKKELILVICMLISKQEYKINLKCNTIFEEFKIIKIPTKGL